MRNRQESKDDVPLTRYRVLDLTGEEGFLCGRILADLGVDVIKIEKPGGDPARNIGPFYHDRRDPEKSLYWLAYNASKRGITLNLEVKSGRELFLKLVGTADVVVESFPPGYLDKISLSYPYLKAVNPPIIMTSITPFGEAGPYSRLLTSDIVATAMGGMLYITGDEDKPPVRISVEQSYLHAGINAAIGTLLALYHRESTGEGQQVGISIQQCVVRMLLSEIPEWGYAGRNVPRLGNRRSMGNIVQRQVWACKDGYIAWRFMTGPWGDLTNRLVEWMRSEGMVIRAVDWKTIDAAKMTQEEVDSLEAEFASFFSRHSKEELYEESLRRGITIAPVSTIQDALADEHLKAREFWVEVLHPHLDTGIVFPGAFYRSRKSSPRIEHPAPHLGEHNSDIYIREVGLSHQELAALKKDGAI